MKGGDFMGKLLVLSGFALVLSLFVVQNAAGQTATPTPTSEVTATPTPTGEVMGATVPSEAPSTGFGGK